MQVREQSGREPAGRARDSKEKPRRWYGAASVEDRTFGLPDADAGVFELSFYGEPDGVAGSDGNRFSAVIISPPNAMQPKSDKALLADQVRRDLEGLVPRGGDLSEAMHSSVVDDEQDDIGPIVIFHLENDGPGDLLRLGELRVVLDSVAGTTGEEHDSQTGRDAAAYRKHPSSDASRRGVGVAAG